MAYTTIDKPTDYFDSVIYTGNGGADRDISGLDFQPDWVWIKDRASPGTTWHHVFDSSRGVNKPLNTNVDNAQGSVDTFPAFNSNGFRVNNGNLNSSSQTNVAWCWRANGGTTTSGAGNDTIATSAHQANTTSGFSIVTYEGEEANKTVKHGLSTALDMLIVKNIDTAKDYRMWFKGFSGTERLELNNTEAKATTSTSWNGTVPSSSVFSLGNDTNTNTSGDSFVAYCFHAVKGFSSFGKYIGNGNNNGPFLYTGFRPAMFWRKRTDGANGWNVWDSKRTPENEMNASLTFHTAAAEDSNSGYNDIDFCSNGIKIHDTGDSHNGSDMNYIYGAWAENPFVSSSGVPAVAY